jgi:hypothetical protein
LSPEWALFRFLSEWTGEDLEIAIRKDILIDRDVLSAYMGSIEETVSKEILGLFEVQRPDLHRVLSKKEGLEWVKKNIRQVILK